MAYIRINEIGCGFMFVDMLTSASYGCYVWNCRCVFQTGWKKRSLLICRFISKDNKLEIYNVSRGHAYWIILASSTPSLNLTLSPIELCELIEVHPVVQKKKLICHLNNGCLEEDCFVQRWRTWCYVSFRISRGRWPHGWHDFSQELHHLAFIEPSK